MFHRLISPIKTNSFFIFGARGTGKSTFLQSFFAKEKKLWLDLLDPETEETLLRDPSSLKKQILAQKEKINWVVIDEIQKQPKLLDTVHSLIEATSVKFAITGSSARKLKHGSANLLAGRAFLNYMFPLTCIELKDRFDLKEALQWGTLPKIFQLSHEKEKIAFLKSYSQIYLKEEIWSEHIIRKLDPFRRFLEIAAQTNGEIVNYTNISKDTGADVKTIQSYFNILEDTLIGFMLEPYHRSVRKQQRMSPKFYFFDLGVQRALSRTLNQIIIPQTYGYGKSFEHFLITEIYRLNQYFNKDYRLSYLLTKDQAEIDLILERPGLPTALIEIKSSSHVDGRDTKILKKFGGDFKNSQSYILSEDPTPKKIDHILALPWLEGLQELGLI